MRSERARDADMLAQFVERRARRGVHLAGAELGGERCHAIDRVAAQDEELGPRCAPLVAKPRDGLQQVPQATRAATRDAGRCPAGARAP